MSTPTSQEIEEFHAYHRRRDERRLRDRETLRQDLLERARPTVRRLAAEFPSLRRVHLFGSILQPGRFTRRSDIDMAVEIDNLEEEGPFARAVERALGWPVDLRPHTGPIVKAVETYGETLYEREIPGS